MEETKSGRKFYPRPSERNYEIDPDLNLEQLFARRNEVANIIDELRENIDSITDQINFAKEAKELTGKPVDTEWAGKVTVALSGYRRVHREHERALKAINRRINGLRSKSESQSFIAIAQQLLEPEMFHRIWGRVRQQSQTVEQ